MKRERTIEWTGVFSFFEADSEKKMRHLLLSKNVTELLRNCIDK